MNLYNGIIKYAEVKNYIVIPPCKFNREYQVVSMNILKLIGQIAGYTYRSFICQVGSMPIRHTSSWKCREGKSFQLERFGS